MRRMIEAILKADERRNGCDERNLISDSTGAELGWMSFARIEGYSQMSTARSIAALDFFPFIK